MKIASGMAKQKYQLHLIICNPNLTRHAIYAIARGVTSVMWCSLALLARVRQQDARLRVLAEVRADDGDVNMERKTYVSRC
jgi:hypothetical protein